MKYDNQGFIIGNRQLEQLKNGIHRIDVNVEQILSLLLDTQTDKIGGVVQSHNHITQVIRSKVEQSNENISSQNKVNRKQTRVIQSQNKLLEQQDERLSKTEQAMMTKQKTQDMISHQLANNSSRLRNAKGQFVKADGSNSTIGKSSNHQSSGNGLSEIGANIPQGIDPTLDAIGEIADGFSTIKNKFSWLKRLKFWRNQEKHQREERRLLRLLLGKFKNKNGRGFLSNLLGGFGGLGGKAKNSKIFKFLGKFLKRIPVLGALIGGGLLLSDWDNLDTVGKGKAVGELGGGLAGGAIGAVVGTMVFPVVGTVIGGLLGAWLGSEAGESIGGAIAPHFKSFANKSLTAWRMLNQNFLSHLGRVGQFVMTSFSSVVKGFEWVKDTLKSAFDSTVKFISDIFSAISDKIKQALSFVPNVIDNGRSLYEKTVDGASNLIEKTVNFFTGADNQKTSHQGNVTLSNLANKIGNSIDIGRQLARKEVGDISRYCALVIRHTLNSVGVKGTFGHGSQVAGNLLRQHSDKFEQVRWDKNYVPMKGDIMSIDSKDAHNAKRHDYKNYGHVAIFDGKQWVSQFNQGHLQGKYGNTIAINDGYYKGMLNGTNKVTIARPKGSTIKQPTIQQPQLKTPVIQKPKQVVQPNKPMINAQTPALKQPKLAQVPSPPVENMQVNSHTIKVSVNPQQVGQNVSHQDLAHVLTGGFGNNHREQV